MSFTNKDIKQIEAKGLTVKDVESQIALFQSGIPFTNISQAATIGNGIIAMNEDFIKEAITYFESKKNDLSLVKFVPASGAATRMFKFLFQFVSEYNPKSESINSYINKNKFKDLSLFLVGLEKFPFYAEVLEKLSSKGVQFNDLTTGEKAWHFAQTMLEENELNFGDSPKGLLPFHRYKSHHISTAFEEHLYEGALYASYANKADLHFTISERHKDKFSQEFRRIEEEVEKITGICFNISFSYQHESTDTIAVTFKDEPFREDDDTLLFRPSG
ncbi:MAG: DUF4301 family protein, partial [Winogradskyella sp.]|nr:DUF4301 family protein [Winogradskyella sp.]